MKNILFLILIIASILQAKACKLDVYFGNGVWNDKDSAIKSKDELRVFLQTNSPSFFSIEDETTTYEIKYIHNKTYGYTDDLLETFWQLFEARQISEGYFTTISSVLSISGFNFDIESKIGNIIQNYNLNVDEMINIYQSSSFNQKNEVLLIAHSQGNLFGNKIYPNFNNGQQSKFKMVSVGTPASNVLGIDTGYTTLHGDFIINPIPNALPTNTYGLGHTFVDNYLNKENTASVSNIIKDVNIAINTIPNNGCEKYEYYRWISYDCIDNIRNTNFEVDVYGYYKNPYNPNTYITEIAYTDSRSKIDLINGMCPIERSDWITSVNEYDKDGCYAYSFKDTFGYTTPREKGFSYGNLHSCSTYSK